MNYHIKIREWKQIIEILRKRKDIKTRNEDKLRRFIEAIWYITRSGCQWRLLPSVYGSWRAVHYPSAISEEILENTAWHQIRKGLIEEFGEAIDKVWFSKAVATECQEAETLTLTMPTRFLADWVRNNYSHVIRRLSERCGVKSVEYDYV